MAECSQCGHVMVELGPAGSGAEEHRDKEFDPAPYLRAELVSDLPAAVAVVKPGAWCAGCRTLFSADGGGPIEWGASWGEPTSVIAPVADPEGLVRHWMGEMDGPLDAVFTLVALGRWRGDTLLELYGCYQMAGRGPYWGWSTDDVLPLTRRAVELVEQLAEADFARLSIEGTLAQIYAEHARTLTRDGSDEAIDAWDRALAADDRARCSDEEIQADAAECFFFAGDNGAAFELATSLLNHRRQYLDRDVEAQLTRIVADIHRERDEPLEALSWRLEQAWAEINMDPIWQFTIPTEADIEALLIELRHDPDQRAAADERVRSLVARLEAGEPDRYDLAAAWLLNALEASASDLSYNPAVQQILDRLDGCPSCGAPVFDLIYDDPSTDDADDGFDARAWMRVWAEPLEDPLAGGTHPTGLCVGCGRAADHYRPRAICWRPASGPGSLASFLVPPLDQPHHTVQHGVDLDADSYAAQIEFLVLRGRWSHDVELEAIALARLLQCMRDNEPAGETKEIVRARDLLDDERLSNRSRMELHAEVGRGLVVCRPTDALEHLRAALRLAQQDTIRAEPPPSHREGLFTMPTAEELALDITECTLHLGYETKALGEMG